MTNSNPLVSIITPTFNHEEFIGECIESVINQTYRNWEMIVVNDGSTDKTSEIVAGYARKDPRIKLIDQENVGIFRLSETYNKALSLSSGKYIAILEGDDYWIKEKLEIQVEQLEKQQGVLCWGQAYSISSDKKTCYGLNPSLEGEEVKHYNNTPAGVIMNIFLFRNCIPALTILINKEALISIGGFRQPFGLPLVDLPTLCWLAFSGSFIFIPKPLGTWRIYATQVTKTYPAKMMEGFRQLALGNYEKIKGMSFIRTDITKNRIKKYYNRQLIMSYSRSGRYKLIRREFKSARKDYLKSICGFGFYEPVWKVRSFVGFAFSLFHLDVEGLSKFLGKKTYR